MSVDGFIEDANGKLDWVIKNDEEIWQDVFATLANVDTIVLGRVMYPGFEQYWLSVLWILEQYLDNVLMASERVKIGGNQ